MLLILVRLVAFVARCNRSTCSSFLVVEQLITYWLVIVPLCRDGAEFGLVQRDVRSVRLSVSAKYPHVC